MGQHADLGTPCSDFVPALASALRASAAPIGGGPVGDAPVRGESAAIQSLELERITRNS